MPKLPFRDLVYMACLSAFIGSITGSVLYIGFLAAIEGPGNPVLMFAALPAAAIVSLIGTLPGALVMLLPLIYPFRTLIARHPVWSAIPFAGAAMGLSFLTMRGLFVRSIGGYSHIEILWIYSGTTALGFVFMLGRWGKKAHPILPTA